MQSRTVAYQFTDETLPSNEIRTGPLVFLALCWLVSGIGATLPIADTFAAKLAFLLPPIIVSLVLVLINPAQGYALWSLGLGFLVTQTGYQIDIGDLRLSALEFVVLALGLVLLWQQRIASYTQRLETPGRGWLVAFTLYAIVLFISSMIRHVPLPGALLEFKGFVLYPFMGFIVAAGLRDRRLIAWSAGMIIAYYLYVAVQGIIQFRYGEQSIGWDGGVYRASGDYASINTYGITLSAVCLLAVGIAVYLKNWRAQFFMAAVSGLLFLGAVVSVARTVWIACACGILMLLISGKKARYALAIIALGGAMFLMLPSSVSDRINQLSDSSTSKREYYFDSGVRAWQERWLTGWGWGVAYFYTPFHTLGLSPDGVAWYHNDYLNLAEQAGVIGVALYGAYWLSSLLASRRWLQRYNLSSVAGYVSGGQMALVVLLVSAGFEHVLWKADIGGMVGWMSGLMLAAMALGRDEAGEAAPL